MAHNIYDEDGKKIGTIKSEREAAEDDIIALSDNIGCLAILIGGFIVLFCGAAWYMAFYEAIEEGNAFYLFWLIPIIVATFIGGGKISLKGIRKFWSVFWRILLIDFGVGTVSGLVAVLIYEGYMDAAEALVAAVFMSVVYSLFPAVIATWIVRKARKK
jgi:hypothetical protein